VHEAAYGVEIVPAGLLQVRVSKLGEMTMVRGTEELCGFGVELSLTVTVAENDPALNGDPLSVPTPTETPGGSPLADQL
jgi:hypothetical protein